MEKLTIKRGQSLRLECTHSLGGSAVNLTGYTVEAWARLRESGEATELTVAVANQSTTPGGFTVSAETEEWPVGRHVVEVTFQASGVTYYSESFNVVVNERVAP